MLCVCVCVCVCVSVCVPVCVCVLLVDTFLGCARGVVLVLCPFCAFCCALCMCLCDALLFSVHVVGGGGRVSCLCPCV